MDVQQTPGNRRSVLSERMSRFDSSPLRDIFKAISDESIISFAGGLPAIETFNSLALANGLSLGASSTLHNIVNKTSDISPLSTHGLQKVKKPSVQSMSANDALTRICQYGDSSGELWLREWVRAYLADNELQVELQQIIIVTGSQQGLDLAGKLLVDKATPVAIEYPTYLAALQCFSLFGAHFQPLSSLSNSLAANEFTANEFMADKSADVCYLNPTFQNPTGKVYSQSERKAVAEFCMANQAVLIEDDPYRELYYDDCCRTPICSMLGKDASWIYQSSFSKTVAPGFRVGFLAASYDLIPHLVKLKQAADLHTSRLAQFALKPCLENSFEERVDYLCNFYRIRRDNFQRVLHDNFSDIAVWEVPSGGMFFWLTLRCRLSVSLTELLELALQEGVAFMPGEHFYPRGLVDMATSDAGSSPMGINQTIRLNFTNVGEDCVERGLSLLADMIRKHSVSAESAG